MPSLENEQNEQNEQGQAFFVPWRRDVVCGEDRGRINKPKISRMMASMRNQLIGLYEQRKQVFREYTFTSMPDMMETFAANASKLLQWITSARLFLL